ncbi:uncharacterized protein BDW70DRAFT_145517 [Aspergillus foveolatus]|uniref:uncharacterized protein n=1 Tax=Aspergillus foveolatus TaxID=210207 RepID=UPI003CCE3EDE
MPASAQSDLEQLAKISAAKHRKILSAFVAIRDTLSQVDPAKRSFRTSKDVCACADRLAQTIFESFEDMIVLTARKPGERGQWLRFRRRDVNACPDVDAIFGNLANARQEFERAISLIRDNVIENTFIVTQETLSAIHSGVQRTEEKVERIDRNCEQIYRHLHSIASDINAQLRQIAERERGQISREMSFSKFLSTLEGRRRV